MVSTKSASTTTKRHCFIEEDDHGLASIVDPNQQQQEQASFSGNNQYPSVYRPLYNYTSSIPRRTSSFRNVSSPRSVHNLRFYCEEPHFLDSCFGCKKPLGDNRDIFMYRGDTPFCSEECRQEQIEMDEAQEKSLNLSASMRASRKKEQRKSTVSNNTPQDCPIRNSTVAAA